MASEAAAVVAVIAAAVVVAGWLNRLYTVRSLQAFVIIGRTKVVDIHWPH